MLAWCGASTNPVMTKPIANCPPSCSLIVWLYSTGATGPSARGRSWGTRGSGRSTAVRAAPPTRLGSRSPRGRRCTGTFLLLHVAIGPRSRGSWRVVSSGLNREHLPARECGLDLRPRCATHEGAHPGGLEGGLGKHKDTPTLGETLRGGVQAWV